MQKIEITDENVDALVEKHEDQWLPSNDIAGMFKFLASQTIRTWSKEGRIRRREGMDPSRKNPPFEYNVCDAIIARHSSRRIKPFLRVEIDGLELFRCNKCEWWTGRGGFYKNTVPSLHGLLTSCIDCHLTREKEHRKRSPDVLKREAERARRHRRKNRERVQKAAAFTAPDRIDAKRIIDIIDARFPDKIQYNDTEICRIAGVHDEMVRKIRQRAASGENTKLHVVDELFSGLDWNDELSLIHDEIEKDRPAWGPHGQPYCSKCFRSNRTYMAAGMCSTCYKRRNDPDYRPMAESKWAMRHSHCVECGTNKVPYRANGRCSRCDSRWRRRQQKVGSGHGNDGRVQEQVEAPNGGGSGRDDSGGISGNP